MSEDDNEEEGDKQMEVHQILTLFRMKYKLKILGDRRYPRF